MLNFVRFIAASSTLPFVLACATKGPTAEQIAHNPESGVWLNRHTLAEGEGAIMAFFEDAEAKGIDTIYPNFWFHGYVIYPGSDLVPQHPDFAGTNPLAIVLREASARNMTVHPWAEYGFFTHYNLTGNEADSGHILQGHPHWGTMDAEGARALHNRAMGFTHFSLNPAAPQARRFLSDILMEVVDRYPAVHGIHLDRIRYQGPDWSFDPLSIEQFRAQTGMDPRDPEAAEQWTAFREANVNTFVEEFSGRFRQQYPDKAISAAVVPPYLQPEKFQRWDTWAKEGWVDYLVPMLYGDAQLVQEEATKTLDMVPDSLPVHAGIDGTLGAEEFRASMAAALAAGAAGIVVWEDRALHQLEITLP